METQGANTAIKLKSSVFNRERSCLIPQDRACALRDHYRTALFDDVIPWWSKYSPDRECGGFFSCLERDGHSYAGDKFTWMLAREVWMYSHLYNQHEHKSEWLSQARHGADFLLKHGFKSDGKMNFRFTREGQSLAGCLSLYSEVFTAIAFAELGHAADDRSLWRRAVDMYHHISPRLGQPSDTPLLGYPLNVEFHLHAHDMVRMTIAWVFQQLDPHATWGRDLERSVESILTRHWKPDLGVMLENVAMDGQPMLDLPEGRMVHPGHAIESAWMMMEIALSMSQASPASSDRDQESNHTPPLSGNGSRLHFHGGPSVRSANDIIQAAIEIILQSLERGWDNVYGGLKYVTSTDGSPSHVLEADHKLWWPHSETLYALLLAWSHTGREDIAHWYNKVHDYTFSHFPDREFGEWFGYLNRDGSPVFTAKGTAWKCCFHLPRSLFRCYQLLNQAEKTVGGPHLRA